MKQDSLRDVDCNLKLGWGPQTFCTLYIFTMKHTVIRRHNFLGSRLWNSLLLDESFLSTLVFCGCRTAVPVSIAISQAERPCLCTQWRSYSSSASILNDQTRDEQMWRSCPALGNEPERTDGRQRMQNGEKGVRDWVGRIRDSEIADNIRKQNGQR
jgi:hypothetical protein